MGENGKFYWLKLKRDFFKRHDIRVIEAMPNGKDYVLFYLKLLLESVDHEGSLRFSETIPYNEEMLAVVTNTNVDIARSAMKLFLQLGMMEVLDEGTIYMNEVERMIGSAVDNDNANRVRRFREKQKVAALPEHYTSVTKSNESKSIEKETEIEIEKKKDSPTDYDFFQTTYNEKRKVLPLCKMMTEKRKKLARDFLKTFSYEQWAEVCEMANRSEFLTGRNDRGWKADIDFLLRADKAAKILEGFYEKASYKDRYIADGEHDFLDSLDM